MHLLTKLTIEINLEIFSHGLNPKLGPTLILDDVLPKFKFEIHVNDYLMVNNCQKKVM